MVLQPRDMNIPDSERPPRLVRQTRRQPQRPVRNTQNATQLFAEEILDKRRTQSGQLQYLVKFKSTSANFKTSWEPITNLRCHRLIRNYEYNLKRNSNIMNFLPEAPLIVKEIEGLQKVGSQVIISISYTNNKVDLIPIAEALRKFPNDMFDFFKNMKYHEVSKYENMNSSKTTEASSNSSKS